MADNTPRKEVNDDLVGRFLSFNIGDSLYGIELPYVIEIVSMQQITVVPSLPHYILGIMNLRGKVVPVIDVRLKLGQELRPYDDKTCIIITQIEEMQVGLIVDSVAEVLSSAQTDKMLPPEIPANGENYISSIMHLDGKVVLCLDCEKFFSSELKM